MNLRQRIEKVNEEIVEICAAISKAEELGCSTVAGALNEIRIRMYGEQDFLCDCLRGKEFEDVGPNVELADGSRVEYLFFADDEKFINTDLPKGASWIPIDDDWY